MHIPSVPTLSLRERMGHPLEPNHSPGDYVPECYNFRENVPRQEKARNVGHPPIGSYFNSTLSPATSRALIQSNNNLMRTGGVQGAKEKMVFGVINAFQWYADSWK
jgi:hypothetical protein